MNNTLYIKGDTGFKPAILAKLGGTWLHGFKDSGEDSLAFSMPEDIHLTEFKESIGFDNIRKFNIVFLDSLPSETLPEPPTKFTPGKTIKMSIWANKSYKLTGE